jgi:hypothetical protein
MRQMVKTIFILVGLVALSCGNVAIAQPPIQVVSIDGLAFMPIESSSTYTSMFSNCLIPLSGGTFRYPISTLPNGSTVKFIELIYRDTNPNTGCSLYFSEKTIIESTNSSFVKIRVDGDVNTGKYQILKSSESSIILDYSQHFYYLDWNTSATSGVSLCGARVYYQPPNSLSYLPHVTK